MTVGKSEVANCYVLDDRDLCLQSYVNHDGSMKTKDHRDDGDDRTGKEGCIWIENWPTDHWLDSKDSKDTPAELRSMCYLKSTAEMRGLIKGQAGKPIQGQPYAKMGDKLKCEDNVCIHEIDQCEDNDAFHDKLGFSCLQWEGDDCYDPTWVGWGKGEGYTDQDMILVQQNCCNTCSAFKSV